MANSQTVMAVIRSATPIFRNNHDKVAFAVHASFLAAGFALTATGRPAFADDALSSSPTQYVGINGWNEFDGEYAFVYTNTEKGSKKFLVKCLAIGDKLLVDAIADGKTEPTHLAIEVGKYADESREGDYFSQFKNFSKLVADLQSEILEKLDERLKHVSSTTTTTTTTTQSSSEPNEEHRHPIGVLIPPIPDNGGYNDLLPGPGAGMYPVRGGFGGGSMFVGPNDPRFFPGFGDQPGVPPPGARFDPIGPPSVPGFEPGRFTRQPPRRRGGGKHPDFI